MFPKFFLQQFIFLFITGEDEECTGNCKELESALVAVREEIVEGTGAWVIKSHAPTHAKLFGVKESSVVFIRSGIPLLYTGPKDNEEFLAHYLLSNKESSVHQLYDKTFEVKYEFKLC